MYSQYQSYQQHSSNATQNMVWNGQQWVHQTTTPTSYSNHSSYTASQPAITNLVQTYTNYYHGWTALKTQYQNSLPNLKPHENQHVQQQLQWANYYADLASRAAHFYHQNPTGTPDFDLPPPPPPPAPPAPPSVPQTATPQPVQDTKAANESMKRFVDRCLQQCNNDSEKQEIMKAVELQMQKAIKDKTFRSATFWDNLPLIQLQRNNTHTTTQSSYYGPSSETLSSPPPAKKLKVERKNSGFNASKQALKNRAQRFKGPGGITDAASTNVSVSEFDKYMGKGSTIGGSDKILTQKDFEQMTVKGTCTTLEKDYLRLTAPPRAELVRPLPVLQRHLENLKREWKSTARRDDEWFCSQLKAVRQDCTVQRIRSIFTVDVYETHARIALEQGDLNEFNQCQTQLKYLYHLLVDNPAAIANRNEFIAYRLLYFVYLSGNEKYSGGSVDLFKTLLELDDDMKRDEAISHALRLRVAHTEVDYHTFFKLAKSCRNLGGCLVRRIVPKFRYRSLQRICQAYRPSVEYSFVVQELGFESISSGREWLESCGCIIDDEVIRTKESEIHESTLEDKQSLH